MNEVEQPHDSWSVFAVSVFRLNGLIMRAGEDIAKPLGQSSARWQVLGRASRPQTVAQMAKDMGHARQSVQRVADVLVTEGFVRYEPHPTDGRTKLLELTPAGFEVLTAIYHRQLTWFDEVMAKLNEAQLVKVTEALVHIAEVLEHHINANAMGGQTSKRQRTRM